MSVTQTVDIPESHRLTIDVPREIPAGRAVITFSVAESEPVYETEPVLTKDEITARLNEIYKDTPSELDEDIQLAQYKLLGEGDW